AGHRPEPGRRSPRERSASVIHDSVQPRAVASGSQRPSVLRLIALATLPFVVLATVSIWRGVGRAEARVAAERIGLARATALSADAFLSGQLATLQTLAVTGIFSDPGGRKDLPELFTRLVDANTDWDSLGLIGPDGWNLVSTVRGLAAPIEPRTLYIAD